MFNKLFQNLGLTDKEAKVYLANLEIGTNPVSEIGKKSKLNRVTTYDILQKLAKKGLVNSIIRKGIKYFSAVDPELVANEYKKRANELYLALPDLKKLHGEQDQPKVQYFEGIEAVKNIFADSLVIYEEKDGNEIPHEILNYCSKSFRQLWPTFEDDYSKERINKSISLKCLCADDEFGKIIQAQDLNNNRETRLIHEDKFRFPGETIIYKNKVLIAAIHPEPQAILIENNNIADAQRTIFNLAWEFAGFKTAPFTLPKTESAPLREQTVHPITPDQSGMVIRKVGTLRKKEEIQENQVSLF